MFKTPLGSRPLRRWLFTLCAPLVLGAWSPADKELLESLPRDERVRVLRERTWEITAQTVQGQLVIDGSLEDPAWRHVEPVTDFYQGESNEGLPATEDSEVRILFDETNLYIGFRAYDKEPDKADARAMFRDEAPSADDILTIMVDAFNDHRSAVQFVSNMNGVQMDLLQNGETRDTRNANWDTVWDARGRRFESGWEVEVVLPFKSLRFPPPRPGEEVVFGIGFKRNIPRKNEESMWPFVSNDSTWYRPAELGHLRGIHDIKPGRSVEIRPYVLGGREEDREAGLRENRGELGGDIKWGVTPSLTADFTVNTDFAQEEADIQQINFTRFSLFFPEKRQFFLEGERMFQFGIPKEAEMVFTRRIGLSDAGDVIPILAGARVSGRQGAYSIGAMNIQTEDALELSGENFTVLRVRRDVLSRSSVGAVFTNRQSGGRYNRVLGADVNLLLADVWSLEGFVARVDEPDSSSGRDAAYGRFAYETDRFGGAYRYLDLGENFDPGVGFVRRPDSKESYGEVRFSPRPSTDRIRQFHFKGLFRYVTDQQAVLETRDRGVEFTTAFESGDTVTLTYTDRFEFIDESFDVNDVPILPGAYQFSRYGASLETYRRRFATFNLSYEGGGFWDGSRDTLTTEVSYRLNKNLGLTGAYAVNWIDLPRASFTTHLLSTRVQVAFRKDIVLLSLIQYNSTTDRFSSNIRFNWIPKPGSDFFVVYNESDEWGDVFQMKNRSLAVKLNYLFAL